MNERFRPKKETSKESDESFKGPTMNLVIINMIFFILSSILSQNLFWTSPQVIIITGFSLYTFFEIGLIWTPLTSVFTHSGIAHISGNMIFLFIYGYRLEEMNIKPRFIYGAYLITGILSTIIAAPIIGYRSISLGASGSIFGLLGLVGGIEMKKKSSNFKSILLASFLLFIMSTGENTNIFAHLFGLLVGILIGRYYNFDIEL